MAETGILFSPEMVRAKLSGCKTQTRRTRALGAVNAAPDEFALAGMEIRQGRFGAAFSRKDGSTLFIPSPYGGPGDKLWTRETWRIEAWDENTGAIRVQYQADSYSRPEWLEIPADKDPDGELFERYWFQCAEDCEKAGVLPDSEGQYHWPPGQAPTRWRPSIHMPRFACRMVDEIVGVKAERLLDIGQGDACAEGCPAFHEPIDWYQSVWEQINGPGSWGANPWVWAFEFKEITK